MGSNEKNMNARKVPPPPLLFVVSGPSGSGKGTALECIEHEFSTQIVRCPTCTTRSPRPGERTDRDYRFVCRDEFQRLVKAGEIWEFTRTYGDELYGSPRDLIDASGTSHLSVELDCNGFHRVKSLSRRQVVGIFIMPPTAEVLSDRIQKRTAETNLAERLQKARGQLSHAWAYHYILVNDSRDRFLSDLRTVVAAELVRWNGVHHVSAHWADFDSTLHSR